MEPTKKGKPDNFQKRSQEDSPINWNWFYLKSHLIFAVIMFFGMLFFVWWITR